jgi:hypothetical protein
MHRKLPRQVSAGNAKGRRYVKNAHIAISGPYSGMRTLAGGGHRPSEEWPVESILESAPAAAPIAVVIVPEPGADLADAVVVTDELARLLFHGEAPAQSATAYMHAILARDLGKMFVTAER